MNALEQYFSDYLAVAKPALKLLQGGLLTVKTFSTNEIQVRVATNIRSLYRAKIVRKSGGKAKRSDGSLVLCAISQTDCETGEVLGTPRARQFTRKSAHVIREAGASLDTAFGREVFIITLTLPGDTVEAIEGLALHDKEIKNAYLQNFRKLWYKLYFQKSCQVDYVIVSELQERGAIHFHIAIGLPDKRFERLVKRLYRGWWYKLLVKYSDKTGIDFFASPQRGTARLAPGHLLVECEKVRAPVGTYLAKYLSKSASKIGGGTVNTPSRWWGVSTRLRKRLEGERRSYSVASDTFADSLEQVETVAQIISEEAPEIKAMTSKYSRQPLGFIFFPTQEQKHYFFEWIKTLLEERVQVPIDELRRLFKPIFWGTTYG